MRNRADGQEPWCRSLCIRRVFEHEVKRLTNQFAYDSRIQQHGGVIEELKMPLPPEGQPPSAIVDGIVGGPNQDGRPSAEGVRYWEEGLYIWGTKSRWASQERMDLMMLDLERQTNWMRTKEDDERAWFAAELQRVRENVQQANAALNGDYPDDGHAPPALVPEDQEMQQQYGPQRHPYPRAAYVSLPFFFVTIDSTLFVVRNRSLYVFQQSFLL